MTERYDLLDVDLKLFDGEGGDGAGGTQAGPAGTQQGDGTKTGGEPGKDGSGQSSDAGSGQDSAQKTETPEARKARYRELVRGEFKDLFTADTQRIVDQRFKETRGLQESLGAQQPIIDRLLVRYGAKDVAELARALETDDVTAQAAADRLGETLEQYRERERQDLERLRTQRENVTLREQLEAVKAREYSQRQIERWAGEAVAMAEQYPDFDLTAELENPEFVSSLEHGVPMELAYKLLHMDEIVQTAAQKAADEREQAVLESIRARGARPPENGASAQNGVATGTDVSKLTREERAEIARRANRGETITLK